jgi:hypothetical protein
MRLRGLAQRVARRYRHADPAVADVTIERGELALASDGVVGTHAERAALLRLGFDAVWIDDPSLRTHEIETPLQPFAAGQRENAIESPGRELPELIDGILSTGVDDAIGAEIPDETRRGGARCRRDDMSLALSRKLHGERADRT